MVNAFSRVLLYAEIEVGGVLQEPTAKRVENQGCTEGSHINSLRTRVEFGDEFTDVTTEILGSRFIGTLHIAR